MAAVKKALDSSLPKEQVYALSVESTASSSWTIMEDPPGKDATDGVTLLAFRSGSDVKTKDVGSSWYFEQTSAMGAALNDPRGEAQVIWLSSTKVPGV